MEPNTLEKMKKQKMLSDWFYESKLNSEINDFKKNFNLSDCILLTFPLDNDIIKGFIYSLPKNNKDISPLINLLNVMFTTKKHIIKLRLNNLYPLFYNSLYLFLFFLFKMINKYHKPLTEEIMKEFYYFVLELMGKENLNSFSFLFKQQFDVIKYLRLYDCMLSISESSDQFLLFSIYQWECYIQDYIDRNSYVVDKKLSLLCFNLLDLTISVPNDIEQLKKKLTLYAQLQNELRKINNKNPSISELINVTKKAKIPIEYNDELLFLSAYSQYESIHIISDMQAKIDFQIEKGIKDKQMLNVINKLCKVSMKRNKFCQYLIEIIKSNKAKIPFLKEDKFDSVILKLNNYTKDNPINLIDFSSNCTFDELTDIVIEVYSKITQEFQMERGIRDTILDWVLNDLETTQIFLNSFMN